MEEQLRSGYSRYETRSRALLTTKNSHTHIFSLVQSYKLVVLSKISPRQRHFEDGLFNTVHIFLRTRVTVELVNIKLVDMLCFLCGKK